LFEVHFIPEGDQAAERCGQALARVGTTPYAAVGPGGQTDRNILMLPEDCFLPQAGRAGGRVSSSVHFGHRDPPTTGDDDPRAEGSDGIG
jgi:hypothetical protein